MHRPFILVGCLALWPGQSVQVQDERPEPEIDTTGLLQHQHQRIVPSSAVEETSDMSDGLSAENYGCNTLTAEEECVSSKDGRPAFDSSPCQWCCGEACTSGGNKCEPKGWLVDQDDYIGHSRSGVGDDDCPVLNSQISGCYTIGDAETCVSSKDGRAAFGASPCQWCCGAACTRAGAKCEPKKWLFKQDDYFGHSRNGFSENTCLKMEGGCVRHSDGCVTSTGFNETTDAADNVEKEGYRWQEDDLYGHTCRFSMPASPLVVKYFHTESYRHTLEVNGVKYTETLGPSGVVPVGDIVWRVGTSAPGWVYDDSQWGRAFKICPSVDTWVDLSTQPTTTSRSRNHWEWYSHGWAR